MCVLYPHFTDEKSALMTFCNLSKVTQLVIDGTWILISFLWLYKVVTKSVMKDWG